MDDSPNKDQPASNEKRGTLNSEEKKELLSHSEDGEDFIYENANDQNIYQQQLSEEEVLEIRLMDN